MTRQWLAVFVAAGVATTAVLGAQENQGPNKPAAGGAAAPPAIERQAPAPQLPAPAQAKGNTVTISGCIQDTPMASAGAPAAAAATKGFYLNNAMAADAGRDKGAVGTSGLTATGYKLEGDDKLITPHLNHQVRITGVVQSSSASPTGAASAAPGSTAASPTLKVESVAMVAAKCEPAK